VNQTFDGFGLAEPLRRALDAQNHKTPTPIQAEAIPCLIEGRDLLGVAQTGTGKTASFALPILQRLAAQKAPRRPGAPRALILAPTRELARQIEQQFRTYGRYLPLRSAVVFGGVNQHSQVKALNQGLDILIATPGRLLDLHQQRHLRLDGVEILVLDEADLMLDMGFIRDVRKIAAACGKERQTLLFSATMPPAIHKLAQEILIRPVKIDVSPETIAVERIKQHVHFVGTREKSGLLLALLGDPAMQRVIVFTRTKRGADRVCRHLRQGGVISQALHGNKSQNARIRALDDFKAGRNRILVATDIAARGIDISNISHVINYDLPNEPESYIHRIGRTARAGAGGIALSFCDASERPLLKAIERLMRQNVAVVEGSAAITGQAATDPAHERRTARLVPAKPPRRRRRRGRAFGPSGEAGGAQARRPSPRQALRIRP
jgi:ATP-dependent RNA helicase RhlE